MPRIRSIKPDFWSDEKLATLSREARLTYVGTWTFSDDYGVIKGHPAWLLSQIFPYEIEHHRLKLSSFKKWLVELENMELLIPFCENNEQFFWLPNFLKHQRIDHPSRTTNPSPPESLVKAHETRANDSRESHESLAPDREGEGEMDREGNRSRSNTLSVSDETDRVISDLNERTGKKFRSSTPKTRQLIRARLKEGLTVDDLIEINRKKCAQWSGSDMEVYLRPLTLYGTKAEGYLNEKDQPSGGFTKTGGIAAAGDKYAGIGDL